MRKIIKNIATALSIVVGITIFTAIPAFASQEGWIQNSDGNWSYYNNGNLVMNTILTLNGNKKYYLNSNGIMATGWIEVDTGIWCYFYANGEMAKNTKIDGYDINDSGKWLDTNNKNLATYLIELGNETSGNGWRQNSDGTWSYYNWQVPVRNTWLTQNNKNKYYIKTDGKMAIGWTEVATGEHYYFNSNGELASNQKIDNYLVNDEGKQTDGQGNVSVNYDKVKPVGNALGKGTKEINYDTIQVFRDGSKIEIWVWNPQDGKWNKVKILDTVPPKQDGKDDDLKNGQPTSITYTDYTNTTLQLAPQGHEYIIAVKWKARYRGVTIEVCKDNFYSDPNNKEKVVLLTKNI
jgi:hypothetical protein